MIIVDEDTKKRFFSRTRWILRGRIWHLEWVGSLLYKRDYGVFKYGGKDQLAHRIAFLIHHGCWPKPQCNHVPRCNWGSCVWWKHLYAGTQSQNTLDQVKVGTHPMLREEIRIKARISHKGMFAGEKNPSAKLSNYESDVEIPLLLQSGFDKREVADMKGISYHHLCKILRGACRASAR